MKKIYALMILLGLSMNASVLMADDEGSNECPVGLVTGMTIDDEFGAGTNAITRCLEKRNKIKVVMQVNKACRDTGVKVDPSTPTGLALDNHANTCNPGRGYGIAQMKNMIKDWRITHGIPADKLDLHIIVHGGGGTMLLNTPVNKLANDVKNLVNLDGTAGDVKVKFHFCMNTIRGMAKKMAGPGASPAEINAKKQWIVSKVIPGVTYVTGGLTALADFEEEGYMYIHP